MTGSPEEFEDRIRRVLGEAGRQLPVRRAGWEGPSQSARRSLPRPGLGGIAMAVGVAVVAAIVVIALGALKHSQTSPAAAPQAPHKPTGPVRFNTSFPACGAGHSIARPAPATGAPSTSLTASLAVLRRPTRPSDRLSKQELRGLVPGVYVDHIRFAQRVAGTSYYVVPTAIAQAVRISPRCLAEVRAAALHATSNSSAAPPDRALIAKARKLALAAGDSTARGGMCVLAVGTGGATSGNCVSELPSVPSRAFRAASDADALFGVVPDGVARVTARYAHLTLTATVVGNVYVIRAPQGAGAVRQIVWLNARGQAITIRDASAPATGEAYAFSTASPPKAP